MNKAWFRFYEELNDFLPSSWKKQEFAYEFEGNPSVKDIIESIGVPHPEVDLVLVNGESVSFFHRLNDGAHVSVYPVFESLDIEHAQHLRAVPLRDVKFILDVHLGKLAKYLRLLGFDSEYGTDLDDNVIISRSLSEKRIILTRDKLLLKNGRVTHGYFVRSIVPKKQVQEVILKFDLFSKFNTFSRCLECNVPVEDIPKDQVAGILPEKTRVYFNKFWMCPNCKRVYWEGSHFEKMKRFVDQIKSGA